MGDLYDVAGPDAPSFGGAVTRTANKSLVRTVRPVAAIAVAMLLAAPAHAEEYSFPGDAPYSVDTQVMDAALACKGGIQNLDGSGVHQPVLLVHGTALTREDSYKWNYWIQLPRLGFEVCWVQLPDAALEDIQVSSEYVARAIERMHLLTGQRIDMLGHSQGGLEPRWAIKWFPSGIWADDYVALATPNHGTRVANLATNPLGSAAAVWQMEVGSNFLGALNAQNETPGFADYTSIYSRADELVRPVGTEALKGGANYLLQDICPGRATDHGGILADAVAYELVIDAFTHRGPARRARLPERVCARIKMPGARPTTATFPDWGDGDRTTHEPPLADYARGYTSDAGTGSSHTGS